MLTEIFKTIIDWYTANINYYTITLLMAIESSFIPFPSEIVVPPAAYKAACGELNIYLVVFFSTFGALLGALFNYYLAMLLGRALIYKFANTKLAHFFLINASSVEKSEIYFRKHGAISTFVGRLVPAIRQLISLPAGLAKMDITKFILYTTLGAGIWNVILAVLGYFLYSQQELLKKYYFEASVIGLGLGIIVVGYLMMQAFRGNGQKIVTEQK